MPPKRSVRASPRHLAWEFVFFLQTILSDTIGLHGPLWGLANEFCYTVFFPVAVGARPAWACRRVSMAIPLSCLAIFIGIFLGRSILIDS